MASSQVETVSTTADKAKLGLAVVLLLASLVSFYLLAKQGQIAQWGALIACLVISADSTDIHSMRPVMGRNKRSSLSLSRAVRTPTMIRSGFRNTSTALPRRRFSGEQAK